MNLLTRAEEIDIEREYIGAILDAALRGAGAAQAFAARAQISPVHLSYIRHRERVPRLRVAQRIACALPLPYTQREEWLGHVEQIWRLRRNIRTEYRRLARADSAFLQLAEIQQAHSAAVFAPSPRLAKSNYRTVVSLSENLLDHISPNRDPMLFVELCFLAHDALCVLDRNDRALWHAIRARGVAANLDSRHAHAVSPERYEFIQVNALRAEAVALYNLKLYRPALDICRRAEDLPEFKRNENFWKPHLYRDMINALHLLPRFSITQAENLAEQVQRICDARANADDPLMNLLISISLARACIAHRNLKDAIRILAPWEDHLAQIPLIGPLHRASYYRTWANVYSARGDFGAEWKYFFQLAARIAAKAGLDHQLAGLRQDAGAHAANEFERK